MAGHQLITSVINMRQLVARFRLSFTFITGDVVYVIKNARRLIGGEAGFIMP
jgi:hypothetical protein